MLKKLLQTNDDTAMLVLRLSSSGILSTWHAKVFGWFGAGFLPPWICLHPRPGFRQHLLSCDNGESWGRSLLAGLFTRIAALGIGVNMVVCALSNHVKNGFFMNWMGTQKGEGFEYHLLAVAISAALIIRGGGKWSLDGLIERKFR
jgi:putative oxidoreductase